MYLQVKVIPKSPRTAFVEWMGPEADGSRTAKIRLKAAPEKGRANEELIRFLAESCGCGKEDILIISGHTSTRKLLRIPEGSSIVFL